MTINNNKNQFATPSAKATTTGLTGAGFSHSVSHFGLSSLSNHILHPYPYLSFTKKRWHFNSASPILLYPSGGKNLYDDLLLNNKEVAKNKYKLLTNILGKLTKFNNSIGFEYTGDTQLGIEKIIFNQFELFDKENDKLINNVISSKHLAGVINDFFFRKQDELAIYVEKMSNGLGKTIEGKFISEILKSLGSDYIKGLLFIRFLSILTYQNSDNDNVTSLTFLTLGMGNECLKKYLYNEVRSIQGGAGAKFNESLSKWYQLYPNKKASIQDDTFISKLGGKFVDVLETTKFLKKVLETRSRKEKTRVVEIFDEKVKQAAIFSNEKVFVIPPKLPMVVKPKEYSSKELGGYLLNNVKYVDELIIPKKSYGKNSVVREQNFIYHMINNIARTPFKINTQLLKYITSAEGSYLLLNPATPHKYDGMENLNKRQKDTLKSHNSKVILQETIMDIADFYSGFTEIFFPVEIIYITDDFKNYISYIVFSSIAKIILHFFSN